MSHPLGSERASRGFGRDLAGSDHLSLAKPLRLEHLLYVLILTLPLSQYEVGPFVFISAPDALHLFLVIVWLANLALRAVPLRRSGLYLPMLLFLGTALASIVVSPATSPSLRMGVTVTAMAALTIVTVNVVSTERTLDRVLLCLMWTSIVLSLSAFVQQAAWYLFHQHLFTTITQRLLNLGIDVLRSTGMFWDPNALAMHLLPTVVMATVLLGARQSYWVQRKRFVLTAFVLSLLGLVSTFSKGAILSLLLVWTVLFLLRILKNRLWRLLFLPALVAAIYLFNAVASFVIGFNPLSYYAHTSAWWGALEVIRESPLLGLGLGNTEVQIKWWDERAFGNALSLPGADALVPGILGTHNLLLEIAVGSGLLTLLSFLAMVLMPFVVLGIRTASGGHQDRVWTSPFTSVLAAYAAVMLFSMTLNSLGLKIVWLYMGLIWAVLYQYQRRWTNGGVRSGQD